MRDLFTWHVFTVGIWTGCIATEAFFEKLLADKTKEVKTQLAKLHYWVDLCIEIPVSLAVYFTGLKLMLGRGTDRQILLMSTFGTAALVSNIACFYNVWGRYQASITDDWEKYEKHDKIQHRVGKGVVHSVAGALAVALYMSRKPSS